jgi:hypothetical protein
MYLRYKDELRIKKNTRQIERQIEHGEERGKGERGKEFC